MPNRLVRVIYTVEVEAAFEASDESVNVRELLLDDAQIGAHIKAMIADDDFEIVRTEVRVGDYESA